MFLSRPHFPKIRFTWELMWKKNVWISALYVGDDGRYQCDYNFATTICNFDHGLRSDQKVTLLLRDDHVLLNILLQSLNEKHPFQKRTIYVSSCKEVRKILQPVVKSIPSLRICPFWKSFEKSLFPSTLLQNRTLVPKVIWHQKYSLLHA